MALRKAAETASRTQPRVTDLITWETADLRNWDPAPRRFELVSAQYMHLPRPRLDRLFARLVDAVAPGGTLLLSGHHPDDPHERQRHGLPDMYFTAEQVAGTLDARGWRSVRTSAPEREVPDGRGGTTIARDTVLHAVRHP